MKFTLSQSCDKGDHTFKNSIEITKIAPPVELLVVDDSDLGELAS